MPVDAWVYVDGKELGTTPYLTQLSLGKHKVTVAKIGYQSQSKEIELAKRGSEENFKLQPISINPEDMDMVFVAEGKFKMGSNEQEIAEVVRQFGGGEVSGDIQFFMSEKPQHEVYVEAFYLDKYEVTQAQYKKFVEATGWQTPRHWERGTYPEGERDFPVVYVSWNDANAYCRWVGKRLPKEEEWEKAARGTDARIWPWGNKFDPTLCNVEAWEGSGPKKVGSYPEGVSPYGAYDMAGNVWEWTDSWYETYPGSTYTAAEFGKKFRVLRGGSWYHYDSLGPIGARCASRDRGTSDHVSYVAGFRCAIGKKEVVK
jgi:formylglycine-generating enzyme required for sulfatase activity